ncbi:MAG: aldehyde ferredoxin oxidoreductase C-terminal domain-containing protein [Chloroflexota bacterium]
MTTDQAYTGRIVRADLSHRRVTTETVAEETMRRYVGGTGLGAKFLYDMVPPGTAWDAPENIIFFGSGPLGGTVGGTGTFSVVTKGPQTNGAAATQANGFLGAFLRFSGYHGVLVEGKANDWQYLYVHDGTAELRDARQLVGRDTWETGEIIGKELGLERTHLSVFGIGPAGENLVRFAVIVGDEGHVASKGGAGAVMGAKKLKAIAVKRGKTPLHVKDMERVRALGRSMLDGFQNNPASKVFEWGTSLLLPPYLPLGLLPIKNLMGTDFPTAPAFGGKEYRPRLDMVRRPCWGCPSHHCHLVTIKEGPYAGARGDEPEFEDFVAFGPLIGQTDPQAVIVLNDLNDRLGMDANEAGWLLALAMECYERGIITRQDTGGIDLTWGNVAAVQALLPRIARREGIGDLLAEGTMRAAAALGGEAPDMGVYFLTGAVPRSHDHRVRWEEALDVGTSSTSTMDSAPAVTPGSLFDLEPMLDPFDPAQVARQVVGVRGRRSLEDSLTICSFTTRGTSNQGLCDYLNAVTGWDWAPEDVSTFGHRVSNLLRCFDLRHGRQPGNERPSTRYGSTPTYGPGQGKNMATSWAQMKSDVYARMGWNEESGKPFPETLRKCGLEGIIRDIYPEESDVR